LIDRLREISTADAGAWKACRKGLADEYCFCDGRERYDLKLAFKRKDIVAAERGYAGPVVVCSVHYEPIAGHRASAPLVKYLSEGRDMEVALAPAGGVHLLMPFRVSVASRIAKRSVRDGKPVISAGMSLLVCSSIADIFARWVLTNFNAEMQRFGLLPPPRGQSLSYAYGSGLRSKCRVMGRFVHKDLVSVSGN